MTVRFTPGLAELLRKPALNKLIAHAAFDSSLSVFEFGCGTGAFAARLLQHHLPADARYVGIDISGTMVSLAQKRLEPWSERARVSDFYSDLSCIAFRASATVIMRVIGSTGEAMKPHFS